MKWKDKPALNKLAEVLMVLGIIGYFGLNYLKKNGETVPEALPKFCFTVVWLCLGISYWKVSKKTAIVYFVLAAVWLLITLLYGFGVLAG